MTTTQPSLIDHAIEYASWGWKIFPLLPRGKKPLPGSNGFLDASNDAEQIEAWWAKLPTANIGLATGPASGVVVIDLDVGQGKRGLEEWAELEAKYGKVETATAETGSGGQHLFFLDAAGFRNRKISLSIDARGDGGYVVLPGSIHPCGKAYEWLDHPEITPPAPLPQWLMPDAGNLAGLVDQYAQILKPAAIDAADRCWRYLEKVPDAISGQGGHGATLRAAGECFRFGLTDSQAWELLNWFNQSKCQPAWSEKELRHKLREGRKLVDREGKFGARLEEGGEIEERPTAATIIVNEPEAEPIEPESPATAFPDSLINPPGVVGEICRWTNATAYKPQPILSLANSLAFFGAVLGQRVRTPSDLRTNLYCLGVGESGCGKDHSRKCIKKICEAAGVTGEVLGGEELASDSAIMASVYRAATNFGGLNGILFQLDEIGHMLSIANSKYASAHMQNISPTFMRLFSSANTTLIGREYAQRKREDVPQPCVSLYGTTVPDRLFGGLSRFDITNGFLGRMLVFISDAPDPAESEKPAVDVPDSIIETIKHWRELGKTLPRVGQFRGDQSPQPLTVPFDDEATAALDQFVADCGRRKAAARDGNGMDVLWSRAPEHARKVALILACGCSKENFRVSGDISDLSVKLIELLTESLIRAISANMADSDFHRAMQRVMKVIVDARRMISRKELRNRTQSMTPRIREEVLKELIETERIEVVEKLSTDKAKRPARMYRVKKEGYEDGYNPN